MWQIRFRGWKDVELYPYKGLEHIACLIRNQGKEVSSLSLSQGHVVLTVDAPEGLHERERFDLIQPVYDEKAMADVKGELNRYDAKLRDPGLSQDEQLELMDKKQELERWLQKHRGLGGKPRALPGADERARQSVAKNINTALEAIEKVCPSLYEHLKGAIGMGGSCVYRPKEPEVWTIND